MPTIQTLKPGDEEALEEFLLQHAPLVVPTVTYDFGIGKNANIYAGIGASAVSISDGNSSVSLLQILYAIIKFVLT